MLRFVVVCSALLLSLDCVATGDARLVFRDRRPLSVTVGAQDRLAPVSLCNTGRSALRRVQVAVKGFGFLDGDGKPLIDTDVLGPSHVTAARPSKRGPLLLGRLPAGRCRTFVVRKGAHTDDVADGTYTGLAVAIARGGGIATRTVRVAVPGETVAPPPTALGQSVTLIARTASPFDKDAQLDSDANVALVSATRPVVPPGCRQPTSTQNVDCFVGNVSHGTDVAWVYVSGNATAVPGMADGREHAWTVPIRMVDADQIGEYKGALDFGPGGKDSKPTVDLTVDVGDKPGFPIAVVVAIQLIALGLVWWRRRHTPRKGITKRLASFPGEYRSAWETYHVPDRPGRQLTEPSEDKIDAHLSGIRGAADAYDKSTMLYSPTSNAYKAILESIDGVDADIKSWRETLGPAMDALADAIEKLPQTEPPALAGKAASLLAPQELEVGEAVVREQRAVELTQALDQLASVIADLDQALRTLDRVNLVDLPDEDARRRRERAAAMLDGARWRAWNATKAEDLDAAATRSEIAHAQLILDELRHSIEDRPEIVATILREAMLAEHPQVFLETMQNLQYAYRIAPEPLVAGLDIGRLIEQAEDVVSRAATSPVVREVSGWLLDVVVFLVTAGAALVVAISAIHIGDTFGTFWDYLKLIAVSITAPVVGVAALEAVGRFRLLRSDPLLRSEAEPAQVTT